ncbi:alpha/beta fold hydrolase [Microvirga sp. 0TCS3.31]
MTEAEAAKMGAGFHKGFVTVDGKALHFVRLGKGPPVVMLHASPCSAKVMLPIQKEWADHFTTFAFDLPGFGLSDRLDKAPLGTADLADAIAGGIRALGLEQVSLYGRHTGAGVAVELARRHPRLVSMVLTDGFPVFTNRYTEDRIREYLPPIEPKWDGSHLVWTWFRYREQHIFWPWDRSVQEHRADTDVPDVDFLYRGTVELLQAADTYSEVYASAFRHPGLAMISEVTVPVCYGNRPGDSQYKTLKAYPDDAWVHVFPRDAEAAAAEELTVLLHHPAASHVPAYVSRFSPWLAEGCDYIPTRFGPAYARGCGVGREGAPVLFLHDLPGGIDVHREEIEELAANRPVLAVDLMGNGYSEIADVGEPAISSWIEQIIDCLDFTGLEKVDIYAHGTSAAVAIEMARHHPEKVGWITFRSPPAIERDQSGGFADRYAPDISPSWEGANFLRLWHHLRDQQIWWPWYDRRTECARAVKLEIEPGVLQRRALILLQQPRHYQTIWREVLGYPLLESLGDLQKECEFIAVETDLFAFALPTAKAATNISHNAADYNGAECGEEFGGAI